MIAVGLQRADRGEEIFDRRVIVRVAQLVLGEAGAVLHDEAARIHQPVAPDRVGFRKSLGHHRRDDEIGDAGCRFARAEEQHLLFGQACRRSTRSAENSPASATAAVP